MANSQCTKQSILFVSASVEDACSLRHIAGEGRIIVNVPDLAGAEAVIGKLRPSLVLCDTEIEGGGSWRDLAESGPPSQLIVVSAHADDGLWAEALNRGCRDVLEKPFLADEVLCAITRSAE